MRAVVTGMIATVWPAASAAFALSVTVTPVARLVTPERKEMISGGKRWRRYSDSMSRFSPTAVNLTMPHR